MTLQETLETKLEAFGPELSVFTNLYLDAHRERGEQADMVLLHKTGIYLLELVDVDGMIYGSESTGQWTLRRPDGTATYLEDPVRKSFVHADLLSKKCKGMGPYLIPYVIWGEHAQIVDLQVKSDITLCGPELFLSKLRLQEFANTVIPAKTRDGFAMQLKMLQMMSKSRQ